MSPDLIIVASVGLVALLSLFLRTNIALATFGLGIGYILSDLTAFSLTSTLIGFGLNNDTLPIEPIVRISLTLLPSVLILLRFKGFQAGRFFEHIVPSVFYALLAVLLVMISLPFTVQQELRDISYVFAQFEYFRTAIVAGSTFIAMFDVMVHEKKLERKKSKKKD